MDKINKTTEVVLNGLATNSTKSQEKTLNETGLPLSWISALFKKFQARYTHKWSTAIEGIEELAVTEWSQGLAGLSGEQIKTGLDNMRDEWPPSLPEFRASCLGKGVNGFGLDYIPECYRERNPERLLESDSLKAHRKEVGKKGMAELRNIIKG